MATFGTADTVAALNGAAQTADAIYLRGYNTVGDRGGGWLYYDPMDTNSNSDGLTVFLDNTPSTKRRYKRDLSAVVLDAYMAGAFGDGDVDVNGAVTGSHDDSIPMGRLLKYLKANASHASSSNKVTIRIG